jgi:predicted RNA-binding Zn ribbon-like protein
VIGYNGPVTTSASPAATMKLVGGELCLDFVNTVGGRLPEGPASPGSQVLADKLDAYPDLVAWSRHAGSTSEADARRLLRLAESYPREAGDVLDRARLFREALHRTLRSLMVGRRPDPSDLSRVSDEVAAARTHEVLALSAEGLRWEWPDAGSRLDSPLWPVSRSAASLLTSGDLSRLRQCGGERCGWLFVDRSRNRSRQWCTMEDCGNVSKVRRFRRRHSRRHSGSGRHGDPAQERTPLRARRSSRPSRST